MNENYKRVLRSVSRTTILVSTVYIIIAIANFMYPEIMQNIICLIAGGALLLMGIVWLHAFFIRDRNKVIIAYNLFLGIAAILAGVLVIFNHQKLKASIAVIFGIALFFGAIIKFQNAVDCTRMKLERPWIPVLFGFISLVLSVLTFIQTSIVGRQFMLKEGIFLLVDGITGILTILIFIGPLRKAMKRPDIQAPPHGPGHPREEGPEHDHDRDHDSADLDQGQDQAKEPGDQAGPDLNEILSQEEESEEVRPELKRKPFDAETGESIDL